MLNVKQGSCEDQLLKYFGLTRPGNQTQVYRLRSGCSNHKVEAGTGDYSFASAAKIIINSSDFFSINLLFFRTDTSKPDTRAFIHTKRLVAPTRKQIFVILSQNFLKFVFKF